MHPAHNSADKITKKIPHTQAYRDYFAIFSENYNKNTAFAEKIIIIDKEKRGSTAVKRPIPEYSTIRLYASIQTYSSILSFRSD